MKTILVPVDFSDKSRQALDFAIQLNERHINSRILIMHVLDFPSYSFNSAAEMNLSSAQTLYQLEFIKGAHNKLEEWAGFVSEAGQEVITKMKYGHPYTAISKEIAKEKVDLIVIGSDGSSGLSEILIGSLAEKVIRYAKCPVITIKGKVDLSKIKDMVFASDLSEEQDVIVNQAKKVQKLLHLQMHVLKVKTPRNFLLEDAAQKYLRAFAKRNNLENFTLNTIDSEFSDEGIVAFAEKMNAGLIVMGTHGRTGLAHIFGGNKAEDVANESKIPVLTFKIPAL
jgi:nucleotide-binding universal stress UspA family protein